MWREKRDSAGSLDCREPVDPIAVGRGSSGHDHHVCALAAAFEEAWLKETAGTRRVRMDLADFDVLFPGEASADKPTMADRCALPPRFRRLFDALQQFFVVVTTAIGDGDGYERRRHGSAGSVLSDDSP